MQDIHTRKATYLDVVVLLQTMREDDRLELIANGFEDPMVLFEPICSTKGVIHSIYREDELLAIYGAQPEPGVPGLGRVWMIHKEGATARPREYLGHAERCLRDLAKPYNALFNRKWAGNAHHLPWLKRLGFQTIQVLRMNDYHFYEIVRVT